MKKLSAAKKQELEEALKKSVADHLKKLEPWMKTTRVELLQWKVTSSAPTISGNGIQIRFRVGNRTAKLSVTKAPDYEEVLEAAAKFRKKQSVMSFHVSRPVYSSVPGYGNTFANLIIAKHVDNAIRDALVIDEVRLSVEALTEKAVEAYSKVLVKDVTSQAKKYLRKRAKVYLQKWMNKAVQDGLEEEDVLNIFKKATVKAVLEE